jgi:hypothetical protein
VRLFESDITDRVTLCLAASHLLAKSEYSNFYTSSYTRISFSIGFKKGEKTLEVPTEELLITPKVPTK